MVQAFCPGSRGTLLPAYYGACGLSLLTESELLSSPGPERWGAMGAGWLMTTREEASRSPGGEEPGFPRSHKP